VDVSGEPYFLEPWDGAIDPASFQSWIKRHPDGGFPIKVRSRGPCPRCHDTTQGEDWLYELKGFVTATDDPELEAELEQELQRRHERDELPPPTYVNRMACACNEAHPGRPDGHSGCGALWDLEVRAL
jgi:hypothetical protein